MLKEYQLLLATANKNKAENKKFLEKLKKQRPNNLDQTVNDLNDQAFEPPPNEIVFKESGCFVLQP